MTVTRFLDLPDGRLAYDLTGDPDGPLVVCFPGMGDLRSTWRELAARLAAAGGRVATVDLRGHGESSLGWPSYRKVDVGEDMLALVRALGGPAVLVGNSYSAGAAVLAAAAEPDLVNGLVLTGPFVRDPRQSAVQRFSMWFAARPRLGRRIWTAYWPRFFATPPADLAERRAALRASLARPGGYDAVRGMMTANPESERALPEVRCPALVVMGERDPDFADPAGEARFVAGALGGAADVLMVPDAGHYPQAEFPAEVAAATEAFVRSVACRA